MRSPGVLIVSASTGSGHIRAAEAVRQAISTRDPSLRVEHVDLLDLAPSWVRAAYGDGYELIAQRAPWLWKQVYQRTDQPERGEARWGPLAQKLLFRGFQHLLLSGSWRVCLSTHFLPGQLAAGGAGFPPFAMVVTDLTLHHFWAQPRVPRYFVACDPLARELARSVPGARIETTGIPIAPAFANPPGREASRASLGLTPEQKVVLVMGGGLGLGVREAALAAARAPVVGLRVIAVCGRNRGDAERLRASEIPADRLTVVEYVPDVERYLAAADLVVTKPGGLTTSEVTALGRPMILTRPVPGQEEGNAAVLCELGAAVHAPAPDAVRTEVARILSDPDALERLRSGARAVGRPGAAARIANRVEAEYVSRSAA